jgi:uncharacterized protein YciI
MMMAGLVEGRTRGDAVTRERRGNNVRQQLTAFGAGVPFRDMYALAIIRYRRPFEEIAPHVEEHRAYLRELKAAGVLLASGPFDPRTGGGLLLRLPEGAGPEALDRIRDGDPFTQRALAQYELLPWTPVIGKDALDTL